MVNCYGNPMTVFAVMILVVVSFILGGMVAQSDTAVDTAQAVTAGGDNAATVANLSHYGLYSVWMDGSLAGGEGLTLTEIRR